MKLLKVQFVMMGLFTALSLNASAFTGVGSGGGGDTRCQEFYQLASKASLDLLKIGQPLINQTNQSIQASFVRELVQMHYSVIPGNREQLQGKEAWSQPDPLDSSLVVTYLNVKAWKKLPLYKKLSLVNHELMVSSQYENDGEYGVSTDLTTILSSQKDYALATKSEGFVKNPDGSYSISKPIIKIDGQIYSLAVPGISGPEHSYASSLQGACKYLGFNYAVAYSDDGAHMFSFNHLAIIDDDGRLVDKTDNHDDGAMSAIVCE